jgi:hypothetical protein
MGTRHLFPGHLTLRVGEPIATTGMSVRQTDELTERLRAAIDAMRNPDSVAPAQELSAVAPS